jgi:hypothetical protein
MKATSQPRPASASSFGRRLSSAQVTPARPRSQLHVLVASQAAASAVPASVTLNIEEENVLLQQQVQEMQNMKELSETMRKVNSDVHFLFLRCFTMRLTR